MALNERYAKDKDSSDSSRIYYEVLFWIRMNENA